MEFAASREHVVQMCRTMLERGYLKATEGNVSVRVPGRDAYAVTPSNYGYENLVAEDVAVMGFDGEPLTDVTMPASIESSMHAGIYRLRPDVNAVVHTHQPYASALAMLRKPIPALFDEQVRFLGRQVAIVDYAPSGTGFLASNVAKRIDGAAENAFILANHGVLVLGTDPQRAVFNMALLEKVSLAYLMALLTGEKLHNVPLPIREIAMTKLRADQKKIAAQVEHAMPAASAQDAAGPLPSADETARRLAEAGSVQAQVGAASEVPGSCSAELGYAISEYLDVEDTYRRLNALVSQPIRPIRREEMNKVHKWFDTGAATSKSLHETAKQRIPGGVQHNLAFNHPFPLAIDKAEGAYLWDVDGNRYIDFLQAGGPTLLGSNYPPVRERINELLEHCGPVTGLFHEYEYKLADLIHQYIPGVEMYRALGSGTEGVMAAVRGARAFTGKSFVIKVGGAYHGWSDQMVYSLRVPGTWRLDAKGIPEAYSRYTRDVFPHDLGALKRKLIENRALGGTAAVIVEPVGPESGTRPVPKDFNAGVRRLCDEFGALLIFDEVVTAFRLGMGGAQGYFGVRPDLTVFGKCVAGGYPMAGGVGGRADVMSVFAGGLGGKSKNPIPQKALIGGTLSANPLSCAAGYFAIQEMARTNAPVIAGRAGDRLTEGLRRSIAKYGLPFVAYNTGSIVHLETSGVMLLDTKHPLRLIRENSARKHMMEEMGAAYAANGLITLAGSRMYTSLADTDEVIDDALDRFDTVLSMVEGV